MQDLCEGNGFKGIAAAGWIAPHTFSDKIAAGRPDEKDLKLVDEFAAQVKGLVEKEEDDNCLLYTSRMLGLQSGFNMLYYSRN